MKTEKLQRGSIMIIVLVMVVVFLTLTGSVFLAVSASSQRELKEIAKKTLKMELENKMYEYLAEIYIKKDPEEAKTRIIETGEYEIEYFPKGDPERDNTYCFIIIIRKNESLPVLKTEILFDDDYIYEIKKWGFDDNPEH